MPGGSLLAESRKRPRDSFRPAVLRHKVQSVFAPATASKALTRTRKRPAQQPPSAPQPPSDGGTGRDDGGGAEAEAASNYRAMMHDFATRVKVREKQQLADREEAAQHRDDDEHTDDAHTAAARSHTADTRDRHRAHGREEKEQADEDEDDEDDEEEDGRDAIRAERAGEDRSDGAGEEDDEGGADIDDLTQPATLLQTAADEDDELSDTAAVSLDSSSIHPELLSSDRLLSHFSHYRTLPADMLARLTSSTAHLQPLPPIEGIREKIFALNVQALDDHRPPQQPPRPTGEAQPRQQQLERSAETGLGVPVLSAALWLRDLHIRPGIIERWQAVATKQKVKQRRKLTAASASTTASSAPALLDDDLPHPLQRALLPLLATYRDVVYPCLAPTAASSTFTAATHTAAVQAYCLHVVNHVVRTRETVLRHNAKISEWHRKLLERRDRERLERQQQKQQAKLRSDSSRTEPAKQPRNQQATPTTVDAVSQSALPPEYRDQGFTRCRVLILLPYAHFAYKAINCLLALLPSSGRVDILNRRRYEAEFSGEGLVGPDKDKPADYRYLMTGELNDAFRVGLSLGSRGVRLYAPFHASDVIVASPLGLKLLLDGGEGHDWLSSVEVLVMDQCDVFSMQNWQHVDSCLQALNQLPRGQPLSRADEQHGKQQVEMDISRVKNYFLDSHARYYRQTIVLANQLSNDIHHLATQQLHNHAGLVLLRPLYSGVLTRIHRPLQAATQRQIFNRFHASSLQHMHRDRFDYFVTHIFPALKASYDSSGHVLIVAPSYYDFLRLRNHFKAHHYNHAALSEYSSNSNVSRHRSNFYHGRVKFLLLTERFYFYRRYLIRGAAHLVFYALPQYSSCYEELVNAMGVGVAVHADAAGSEVGGGGGGLCVALYCAYDGRELERIVGTQRSLTMLTGDRATYLFC